MNIGIYIADTHPSGITSFAQNLSSCLNDSKHNCKIISDENSNNNNNVISLGENNKFTSKNIIRRINLLKKIIINNDIDIIISNGWFHDMISILASKFINKNIKVIGVIHTRPNLWNISDNLYGIIKKNLIKLIYKLEDETVVVSKELNEFLKKKKYIKKAVTIYNPVINNKILKFQKIRKEVNPPIELFCLGWIRDVKGIDVAINSLAEINKKIPANLTLIGDYKNEDYFSLIKSQIKELNLENNVKFLGSINNPFPEMNKMDILLLPSRSEVLPTSLIEAMGLGIPVIAADCDFGPREILDNGKYGFLVPVDNYEKIFENVIRLFNNPNLYNYFSEIGIQRSKKFNYNECESEYNELIEDLNWN
jgi:glycosyltransferase involved in cell wall biosynthesis